MTEQDAVESLLHRMVGQTIEEAWIENDEFVFVLSDNTKVALFSDEDLQLYYELGESLDNLH